jgi:hypothetical protein
MIAGMGTEYAAIVHSSGVRYDGNYKPIAMGSLKCRRRLLLGVLAQSEKVVIRRYDYKKSGRAGVELLR